MSLSLVAGANAPLPNASIRIQISSKRPIDCAAYRLSITGKVRGDGDMIFYGQQQSDDASVAFGGNDTAGFFDIQLHKQPAQIEKIALAFSSDSPLTQIGDVNIQVMQGATVLLSARVEAANRNEKALIMAECYRRQGSWKFRFISQGFDGGLKPLSEHFGIEISDAPQASPAPTSALSKPPTISNSPATNSTVNLSKISLTKQQSSINLSKKDNFGKIAINLNWNQRPDTAATPKKGFLNDLLAAQPSGIDLDLGAMVRLKNGEKTLIQALGNGFGNLQAPPYVCLRADDRTGASADGEWLDINGAQWAHISEVLIFAFIYSGAPNWAQTDGVVTLHVPEQPPIETRLSDGENALGMCAIARLVNQNGSITVERINRYFAGHKDMDKAFGWGFSWKRGKK